jgi:hypothetical protein
LELKAVAGSVQYSWLVMHVHFFDKRGALLFNRISDARLAVAHSSSAKKKKMHLTLHIAVSVQQN